MNQQAPPPFYINFGGNSAAVWCDAPLRQQLHRHCHACTGGPAESPAVTYHLFRAKNEQLQLNKNNQLHFRSESTGRLLQQFMQDLTTELIIHCRQHMLFHAGGVAANGHGIILCGESGSGKSTLTTWLVAAGCSYLTDELTAVLPDAVEMTGLPRPIALKAGSAFAWRRWLAHESQPGLTHFADKSVWLDPNLLHRQAVCAAAAPKILLFPRYIAGHPLAAEPLSAGEAAFRLAHSLVNAKNLPANGLTGVARLARRCAAYSLRYGNVEEASRWITGLL